jgi:acyl-CoA thioesterase
MVRTEGLAVHRAPWCAPTSLSRLMKALDLRSIGPQRFEVTALEPQWSAHPSAQLAAAAVIAAERSFPEFSVSHVACAFGRSARARAPLSITMTEIRVGIRCIAGRMEFNHGGTWLGEAAVTLQPDAAGARAVPHASGGQAALLPDVPTGVAGLRRWPPALAPWELTTAPADTGHPGGSCIWSRLRGLGSPGDAVTSDADGTSAVIRGTVGRALLAYLSELLPLAAAPCPDSQNGGRAPFVLSHAITYCAPFDPGDWLIMTVDGRFPDERYAHTRATFRTSNGAVAAMVSQATTDWTGRGWVLG